MRYLDLAPELDAGVVWKAPLARAGEPTGEADAAGNDCTPLSERRLLTNIREGVEMHRSILAFARRWAALGASSEEAVQRLHAALDDWPAERRDHRWRTRRADVPRVVKDMYARHAAELAERRKEAQTAMDEAWKALGLPFPPPKEDEAEIEALVGIPSDGSGPTPTAIRATLGSYELTEDGVIRAFTDRHKGELLFDHSEGTWFRFDGHVWRREGTKLAHHYARDLATTLAKRDQGARALNKVAAWEAVERGARTVRDFAVEADHWDQDPMLLGTPGGVVDLRTGLLRPGRPKDFVSRSTAVAPIPLDQFDPARDCPGWLAFLSHALDGDAEAIRFFQRWAGYCLTGLTREHALLFIYGPGGAGKTTAIIVLSDLLGDYAIAVATSTLTAKKHDAHPEELARLNGPRMAVASETERGSRWAENRIKEMTGGDKITARFMRQNSFSFTPAFKLTVVGNNAPGLSDVDAAVRRRFQILPFVHPPAVKDDTLPAKLRAEGSGILAWAVQGALDWQAHGLGQPDLVQRATAEYFSRASTFARWTTDDCEVGPSERDTTDNLFKSWSRYAWANDESPGGVKSDFPDRMARAGFTPLPHVGPKRGRGYSGIRVRPASDFDADDLI